jgi:AraC-like DNA-binding protein
MAAHFDFFDYYGRTVHPAESELPPFYRRLRESAVFEQLFMRTVEAFHSGQRARADAWFQAALMEVERQDGLPAMDELSWERHEVIDRLCAEIVSSPGAMYRLGVMARSLHCSADHFARVFRKRKGVAPGEFVLVTRLEAAKNLLRGSSHSITRISELLGYRDVYYFSKQFRRRVGMTPTQFRKA